MVLKICFKALDQVLNEDTDSWKYGEYSVKENLIKCFRITSFSQDSLGFVESCNDIDINLNQGGLKARVCREHFIVFVTQGNRIADILQH
jgi:hypothetical protein